MSDTIPPDLALGDHLALTRCPHCRIARPNLVLLPSKDGKFIRTNPPDIAPRVWGVYCCTFCGGLVTAFAIIYSRDHQSEVVRVYPSVEEVSPDIPQPAQRYLHQAIESINAPDGAVMLAASSVDAMLKVKGYSNGSLYNRIEQACEDGAITIEMKKWAHQVRLDANDPRHADDHRPHHSIESAKLVVEFAKAIAEFLFVLPARVNRGLSDAERAA